MVFWFVWFFWACDFLGFLRFSWTFLGVGFWRVCFYDVLVGTSKDFFWVDLGFLGFRSCLEGCFGGICWEFLGLFKGFLVIVSGLFK